MAKYITVKLTDSQLEYILSVLSSHAYSDTNEQTRAFARRLMTTLAKAKISLKPVCKYCELPLIDTKTVHRECHAADITNIAGTVK